MFIFQLLVYITSNVGELKALQKCKVAPESVLSNRGEISKVYALDREGFSPGEVFAGGKGDLVKIS